MTKTLAEDLKWHIRLLYNDEYTKKQIANLLYIRETLVKEVIYIYAKWGCIINSRKLIPERKKVFSKNDMNILYEIINKHVNYYLDEYIEKMHA
ncbi:hypothetical protein C1645_820198 [Glomus cerebriforme]|uniref:Homeodomain-like protein n=1 Tax=Glomus cerebriforme TaxID=658196 RepID=A0A397T3R1_9GLOM|nr:hypothetical protein C1645_820198 [Glomus cerebriforme]